MQVAKMSLGKYLPAVFTAIVWGSTYVASKVVLSAGISSYLLMTIRFALAYLCLWIFCSERKQIRFNRDELAFLVVGMSGGSLYFFFEYEGLIRTSAINVGLICSTVPIVSTFISVLIGREHFWRNFFVGSFLAIVGVFLTVTNGNFSLSIRPVGDLLVFVSALLWAIYTVVLSDIAKRYSPLFISRRLFFYALITILPFTIYHEDWSVLMAAATNIGVAIPLLYLGLVASGLCIVLWNVSINYIGLTTTNNFLYLQPIVTIVASALFISGEVTMYNVVGAVFILIGIYLANKKRITTE
ncbi:MAG: DMT family transporter [Marinilabiliaceae bacterium]|nr:DMT family transporter [Marinilabiliaceae bacterium]